MTNDRENRPTSAGSDAMVSSQYRAIATERPSAELDALILRKAEAATKTGFRGFMAPWYRPFAFAATLALSLAIMFELTSNQYLEPAESPAPGPGRHEPDTNFVAPRETEEFRKDPDSSVGKSQTIVMPTPAKASARDAAAARTNASADDQGISADFAGMIEANSKRMQESNVVADTAVQSLKQTTASEETRAAEPAAFTASAVLSDIVTRPCNAEQIVDPQKWRNCIAELEKSGLYEEAKAELELFKEAYPDFETSVTVPTE